MEKLPEAIERIWASDRTEQLRKRTMTLVEVNTTASEIPSYTLDIHNGTEKTPQSFLTHCSLWRLAGGQLNIQTAGKRTKGLEHLFCLPRMSHIQSKPKSWQRGILLERRVSANEGWGKARMKTCLMQQWMLGMLLKAAEVFKVSGSHHGITQKLYKTGCLDFTLNRFT